MTSQPQGQRHLVQKSMFESNPRTTQQWRATVSHHQRPAPTPIAPFRTRPGIRPERNRQHDPCDYSTTYIHANLKQMHAMEETRPNKLPLLYCPRMCFVVSRCFVSCNTAMATAVHTAPVRGGGVFGQMTYVCTVEADELDHSRRAEYVLDEKAAATFPPTFPPSMPI